MAHRRDGRQGLKTGLSGDAASPPLRFVWPAGLIVIAFVLGRFSVGGATNVENDGSSTNAAPQPSLVPRDARQPATKAKAKAKPKIERPFLTRPEELFVATNAETEARYRRDQSRNIVDLLESNVKMLQVMTPGGDPQAAANGAECYMQGLLDGVIRTAPELVEDFGSEIESTLCNKDTAPSTVLLLSRAMINVPELTTDASLDCMLEHSTAEDPVLWAGLDAWRASGLPKTAAIAALEGTAADERTLERLREPKGVSDAQRSQDTGEDE